MMVLLLSAAAFGFYLREAGRCESNRDFFGYILLAMFWLVAIFVQLREVP